MNKRLMMMMLTIALLSLGFCYADEIQQQLIRQNPCVLKQTCHECIQTPSCAWCAQPVRSAKIKKSLVINIYSLFCHVPIITIYINSVYETLMFTFISSFFIAL